MIKVSILWANQDMTEFTCKFEELDFMLELSLWERETDGSTDQVVDISYDILGGERHTVIIEKMAA